MSEYEKHTKNPSNDDFLGIYIGDPVDLGSMPPGQKDEPYGPATEEQVDNEEGLTSGPCPNVRNIGNKWIVVKATRAVWSEDVEELEDRAEEVPQFKVTSYELQLVAKHWIRVAIEIHYDWFLFSRFTKETGRSRAFAWRRIDGIALAVGQDAIDTAIKDAEKEFALRENPRYWNAFLNGTEEEREEIRLLLRDPWPQGYSELEETE